MIPEFRFEATKAVEVILYIARHSSSSDFHHLSKILYFADKLHLEKYGRFICGDRYVAMEHGPVPSSTYDLLKHSRAHSARLSPSDLAHAKRAFDLRPPYSIEPLREPEPELDELSDSDIECLDHAIARYGALSFAELTELSHDEIWSSAAKNHPIEIGAFLRTFEQGEVLEAHLLDPHPGKA